MPESSNTGKAPFFNVLSGNGDWMMTGLAFGEM